MSKFQIESPPYLKCLCTLKHEIGGKSKKKIVMEFISFQERKENCKYCWMNTLSKTNERFNSLQNATGGLLDREKHPSNISLNVYNYPHVYPSQTRKYSGCFSWSTWKENSTYNCLFLNKPKATEGIKLIGWSFISLGLCISEEWSEKKKLSLHL